MNAAFVVAAVESAPAELVGRADLLTVAFPWGSLLRGIVGCDDSALAGLASLLAPGASIEAFASLVPRDAAALGLEPAWLEDGDRIAAAWCRHGLELLELRPATPAEVAGSGSSWAKRLRSPDRTVVRLTGRRRNRSPSGARHSQ